jgi:hypothetical protein
MQERDLQLGLSDPRSNANRGVRACVEQPRRALGGQIRRWMKQFRYKHCARWRPKQMDSSRTEDARARSSEGGYVGVIDP